MPLDDEDCFTFMWHIKNFSMCPVKHGDFISSPVIKVGFLKDSKWSLRLYPKGYKKLDTVPCYLKCEDIGEWSLSNVKYKLSVFDETGSTAEYCKFDSGNSFSKPTILQLDYIFKNKDECLPNDTLTILCEITDDSNNVENIDERKKRALTHMQYTVIKENMFNSNKCNIATTVEVLRKNVIWPIRRFQALQADEKLTFPVISVVEDIPSFLVTFSKGKTESPTNMDIRINDDGTSKKVFVKCNASVLDIQKNVMHHVVDEFLFESDEVWRYPSFVNLKELADDKYFESTLYIGIDIAFSIEGKLHHLEQNYCDAIKIPITNSNSPAEYRMLTPDEDSSIVRLRTGDRTYEVHGKLLKDKSKVFEAMFQNEMKEQKTGVVEIIDVDPDTLGRLLWFFYSNKIEDDLSLADAINLYRAAHKYQVLSLLSHCSLVLESSLAVSNVTDILSLADLHQDNRLLKGTDTFIRANSHRVLVSQDWKDLIKTNGTLAANVMLKMLTNV